MPLPETKLNVKSVVSESVAVNVPATVPIATSSSIDKVFVVVEEFEELPLFITALKAS